ncbi:MAG: thiamine pyrophosphate-dependent enzyme [Nitrososphaerales archaeon]
MTVEDLERFEDEIATIYGQGAIRGPIHLRSGQAQYLVEIFKEIRPEDWVFGTWAAHEIALLKGVPRELVKGEILDSRSITLCFPSFNLYTSAIVGQIAPWSTGVAHSMKLSNAPTRVFCFLGDASIHTGIVFESIQFSILHDLPITWVLGDNNTSVCTPVNQINPSTKKCWQLYEELSKFHNNEQVKFIYYEFESKFPHSGTGEFVSF